MPSYHEQIVEGAKFSEVLEQDMGDKIGSFEIDYPFLPDALRGLAKRLNHEIVPMGFIVGTEFYLLDLREGFDGCSGEPMPIEVKDMPPQMNAILRMTALIVARDAFGDQFTDEIEQKYIELWKRSSQD